MPTHFTKNNKKYGLLINLYKKLNSNTWKKQGISTKNITTWGRIVRSTPVIVLSWQFMTGWYFFDDLVVNWTCKITILDMIDNHLAVAYMHLFASSSQQTLTICPSNVAIYSDSRVYEISEAECVTRFRVHEVNIVTNLNLVESLRASAHEFFWRFRYDWIRQSISRLHAVIHASSRFYAGLTHFDGWLTIFEVETIFIGRKI